MGNLKRMSDVLDEIESLTARFDAMYDDFYVMVEHVASLEHAVGELINESFEKAIKKMEGTEDEE